MVPALAFMVLQWQVAQCKVIMRRELEQQSLVTIVIPANEIQWKDGRKEVLIENRMFDVKHYFLNNQRQYILTGLFDDHETELLSIIYNNNNTGRQQHVVIATWLNWLLLNDTLLNDDLHIQRISQVHFITITCTFNNRVMDVPCPPPWA